MPRPSKYPAPKKRFHHGVWEIYWYWKGGRYVLHPGSQDPDDPDIESHLRMVSAALAANPPVFPKQWAGTKSVAAYLRDRYNIEITPEGFVRDKTPEDILASYAANLNNHCAALWAKNSLSMVKALDAFIPGGFRKATRPDINRFLESILAKGNKPSTRNRTLFACSRFFNWCLDNQLTTENPCAGIKAMDEPDVEDIAYCTIEERARVIAAAQNLDRPDWIAIPIALYAGCRREEVFNLEWPDINLEGRRLNIRKSKTGKKRTTPIAQELLELFEAHKRARGPVVPRLPGSTWENQADRLVEAVRERLCRPENPNLAGQAAESVGKRRFLMTEDAVIGEAEGYPERLRRLEEKLVKMDRDKPKAKALAIELASLEQCPALAWDNGPWIPAERLGWNAWRHTFATLRVQAGVSLDKVRKWMGNSYKVCEKHYAQFMPRDRHDEDIDR